MIDKKLLKVVDTIDSTNEYIKKHSETLPNGFIIQAHYQTKGKGQRDKSWDSEAGENLLVSFLVKDDQLKPYELLYKTISAIILLLRNYGLNPMVKLPNDIYINDKKIAGLLIETTNKFEMTHYIIGFGLNINQWFIDKAFSATSLHQETNNQYKLEDVLLKFINQFNDLDFNEAYKRFKTACMNINQTVYHHGIAYELVDFSEDFICTIVKNDIKSDVSCSQLKFDSNN
jgi:biotin-[acetyl-CoA-carboxylase] ligase BirA-like protein